MLRFLFLSFSLLRVVFAAPQVLLGHTAVTGAAYTASGVDFFGGIPFARAPVGDLRLQPPVLLTSLNASTFDATNFGPACLQTALPPSFLVSEDCLQLNVFRPDNIPANTKLPVMFWIYGGINGGFTSGATLVYNGTGLVAQSIGRGTPIILVSANYRVGPLGFPQGAEAGAKGSLNLGLRDQIAALQWVQANIEAFGGDKTKVTIMGESAGATSVAIHFLGTHIQGLARAAIAQSAGINPAYEPEQNQNVWAGFVSAVPECASVANSTDTFECLRRNATSASLLQGLSATLTNPLTDTSYFPNLDGPGGFLPDLPSKLTPTARLPVIMGANLDEGTLFINQQISAADQISQLLISFCSPPLLGAQALSAAVQRILGLYPDIPALGSPFGTGNNTFGLSSEYKRGAAIFGDFLFQAPRRALSSSLSAQGIKVFGYQFADPPAPAFIADPSLFAPGSLGVAHTSDIFYVLGGLLNATQSSLALSTMMQDYWISFAVTLDPNDGKGSERPAWTAYSAFNPNLMQLKGGDVKLVADNFRVPQMRFINSVPQVFHR